MGYPLKTEYKSKDPIRRISASDLQTICNMLNLLTVDVDENAERASVVTPQQDGKGWKIVIPSAAGGINVDGSAVNRHLIWDDDEEDWVPLPIITGLDNPATIMTDMRFDVSTKQFQKKTRTLTYTDGVLIVGAETEWTLITGGQAETCP